MEQSSSRYCQPFTSRSVFTHVLAKGAKQPPGADTGEDVVLKEFVGDTIRGSRPVELLDREGNVKYESFTGEQSHGRGAAESS